MSELLTKIQNTLAAVDDIEKAIQERGLNTKGCTLAEYGNLIRRIVGEDTPSYPDGTVPLFVKCTAKVSSCAVEINGLNTYVGVFTPSLEWLTTDETKMLEFRDDIIRRVTFTTERRAHNTVQAVFTSRTNQLVEITELEE